MLQGCAGGLMLLTAALLFLASRKAPPPSTDSAAQLHFLSFRSSFDRCSPQSPNQQLLLSLAEMPTRGS